MLNSCLGGIFEKTATGLHPILANFAFLFHVKPFFIMKSEKVTTLLREWLPQLISFILLGTGLLLDYFTCTWFLLPWVNFLWYAVAFLPVGIPVVKEAVEAFAEKDYLG